MLSVLDRRAMEQRALQTSCHWMPAAVGDARGCCKRLEPSPHNNNDKNKQQTSSNNSSTASTQSPHTATHRHRRTEQTHMVCCQNITSNNSSTASHQGYFFFPRRGISHSASRHAKICYVGRFQKASCRRTGCAGCAALLFAGRRAL